MTKAEKTRQFILEKSAPIFNTRGVAGTAMSDIMEATHMAKGSLYVHFENKEALSYGVVDYNLKKFIDLTMAAASRHATAKEKLFAMIDVVGDPAHPPMEGGCPMINFGMEADDTSPIILKKVSKVADAVQQRIVSLVEAGIEAGEFKAGWDARIFALKTFAMIEGGIMLSRIAGNGTKLKTLVKLIKKEIEENTL